MSDGLGDRLLMFDNSAAPSLELLRFRPELADRPEFETALRAQVQRLSRFQHPAFARVRSVQRLEPDGDLALVSNHTPGKRLSEILHRAHGPAFAAALIRQLAPAVADFQRQHPGTAHGLLSPERIVVSPDARLTIVEHVIGPAMASVGLDAGQFGPGIALAPAGTNSLQLQPSTDWYQLGLVALSVLLGRAVTAEDLPQLETLVGEAVEAAARDGSGMAPLLAEWLERSLQISGDGIASGIEARALLGELTGERVGPAARVLPMRAQVESTASLPRVTPSSPAPAPAPPPAAAPPTAPAAAPTPSPAAASAPSPAAAPARPREREKADQRPYAELADFPAEAPRSPEPPSSPEPSRGPEPTVAPPAKPRAVVPQLSTQGAAVSAAQELSPFEREVLSGRLVDTTASRGQGAVTIHAGPWTSRRVAAVAGIALITGAGLAWAGGASGWSSSTSAFGLQALTSGEHVLTQNGSPLSGPLSLSVGPELSWVRMTSAAAIGVPGAKPESGTLRISSPMPLKVVEQGRALGSVPGADLKLTPGRHDLELVNETVGYRLLHSLEIAGGESVLVQVAPRPGSITVAAAVGTEVTIEGRSIGRTPIAAVTLVPGEYQVVFRSVKGAPDRQRVVVKPDGTTHVVAKAR